MKWIFFAFPGYEVDIEETKQSIEGFEFYDLDKLSKEEFIDEIKDKIPPINERIDNLFKKAYTDIDFENSYNESTFGILFPVISKDNILIQSAINTVIRLFSGLFLPCTFLVNDLGIEIQSKEIPKWIKAQFHKIDRIFIKKEFVEYYNIMISQIVNLEWDSRKVIEWDKENFKLCTVLILYNELKNYKFSKKVIIWQKECSEIVTIYENLLSRFENDNGKYKIIQRIKILLKDYYENDIEEIEQILNRLFNYRNEFIHGSFYQRLLKETKKSNGEIAELPIVEFNFLEKQDSILRRVISIFLFLKIMIEKDSYFDNKNVSYNIHEGIMNIETRMKLVEYAGEMLRLIKDDISI